jgi:class 3 adenylate cyclase
MKRNSSSIKYRMESKSSLGSVRSGSVRSGKLSTTSGGMSRQVKTKTGLQWKNATLMLIDLTNFHSLTLDERFAPDEVLTFHKKFVDLIINGVKEKANADFHYFRADKMLFSWNAVSLRFNGQLLACEAALEVIKIVQQSLHPFWEKRNLPKLDIKVAITTGPLLCGNIGGKSIRQFDIFGAPLYRLFKIIKLNKELKTRVLLDEEVYELVKYRFVAYPIERISFTALNQSMNIFELKKMKQIHDDEWLYELEQGDKEDGANEYNEAFNLFIKGELDKAKLIIQEISSKITEDCEEYSLYDRLKKLITSAEYGTRYVKNI